MADTGAPEGLGEQPAMIGRFVGLRPITTADYEFVYLLYSHPKFLYSGRTAGASMRPEDLPRLLWDGVFCQYLVVRRDNHQSIGIVSVYNTDWRNSHAYVAALFHPEYEDRGWPLEGVLLLVRSLFANLPLEKLYMEAHEYNFSKFSQGAGRFFQVEGRLRRHTTLAGRRWDLYTLAIYRDVAERELPGLLP